MTELKTQHTKIIDKKQSGQTLVEFILILMGIVIISFGFMSAVNSNIADRWQKMATIILDDPNQKLEIR